MKPRVGDIIYKFHSKKKGGGTNCWEVVETRIRDGEIHIITAEDFVKNAGFKVIRNPYNRKTK